MRRFWLIITVISFAGWSQPPQQQAQPPIVVKVQMPPTNPWMHLLELVVPGIIGAGLALFGVWLTNKHNDATNEANRQHQLDVESIKDEIAAQAKSRDNRWEFRKDVYTNLIRLAVEFLRIYATLLTYTPKLSSDNEASVNEAKEHISAASVDLITKATEFNYYANLAPIATAEEVIAPILEAQAIFHQVADESSPEYEKTMQDKMQRLQVLLTKLHAAGRKDLWGTPEAEAKNEG
jgi:hypothetical protein